jgi:hypothetical protein
MAAEEDFMRTVFFAFVLLTCVVDRASAVVRPTVSAVVEGRVLTLRFPESTLTDTVWLKFEGRDVPRSLASGGNPAIQWTGAQEMTVKLGAVKRAIDVKWISSAWVWGQLADGSSLLQQVIIPGTGRSRSSSRR